jgi:hypothetical protein
MYTVKLVDTFSHDDCVILETDSKQDAFLEADKYVGAQMTSCYIYDNEGNQIRATGSY